MNSSARRVAAGEFTRSGALVFVALLIGQAGNYGYYLLLGRTLPVAEYGAVLSLTSAVVLVLGIASVFQTVVAKLAADLRAAGDTERAAAFTRSIRRLSQAAGVGVFAAAVALEKPVAAYLHIPHALDVVVAGAAAGSGVMIFFQRGCLQGASRFGAFAVSGLFDASRTVLVVPLTNALGALGSLLAMFASLAACAIYGDLALRTPAATASGARLDVRRMAATAGATGMSTAAISLLMFYDVVLARHFLDPLSSALYAAAALGGRVVLALCAFIPVVMLPYVAVGSRRGTSVIGWLLVAVASVLVLVVPVAACAWLFPTVLVRALAGGRFVAAAPLVLPYVVAAGELAMANVIAAYAVARHRFAFVPYLLVGSAGEVVAICLRHASALQIVQTIAVGHGVVCAVMVVWLGWDGIAERSRRGATPRWTHAERPEEGSSA